MLNHGYLPRHYLSESPKELLAAYVGDYLREEIAAEGLVRNLPVYSDFLSMAALADTELVSFASIARDCGVSSHTIKNYFQILVDTLLASWLPAYRKRPKRRVIAAPKFYFADVGVVGFLGKRGRVTAGSELFGKAFENWVYHEIVAHNAYAKAYADLAYWRLASGLEVDFVIDGRVAVEAKATRKVTADHLRGLRELVVDHPEIVHRYVVCLESKPRVTPDGIRIVPPSTFVQQLIDSEIF